MRGRRATVNRETEGTHICVDSTAREAFNSAKVSRRPAASALAAYDDNRAVGTLRALLADRAQQRPGKTTVPAGTHHQHRRMRRLVDHHLSRMPRQHGLQQRVHAAPPSSGPTPVVAYTTAPVGNVAYPA